MAQAILEKSQGQAEAPPRRMTWEEFLAWDSEHLHCEWVDGEAFEYMAASIEHQSLFGFLYTLFNTFAVLRGLGQVFAAPALVRMAFRPAGREPDLFFVSTRSIARLTPQFLDGPADLVVEIVSQTSEDRDKVTKLAEYERHGVREYWILDYLAQETFFYQLDAAGKYQRVFADATGRYDCAVIPGFWIDTDWLWREPKPLEEAMRALKIIPAV